MTPVEQTAVSHRAQSWAPPLKDAGRVLRRMVTIPTYLVGTVIVLASLPVLLLFAGARDLVVRRSWPTVRLLLFGAWYLLWESIGLVSAFWLWLTRGPWTGRSPAAYFEANFRLQCRWAQMLYAGVKNIFNISVSIEGDELFGKEHLLVFMRHASIVDTLLPAVLISSTRDLHLRYVLKRELLADPCLDVVGHRLGNVFVDRSATDSAREIAVVRNMAQRLGEDEAAMIYPEGTRFSDEKRTRALNRVRNGSDPQRYDRVRDLRHLLPPRLGGALALIAARPEIDVVLIGHVGLERLSHIRTLFDGSLINRRIQVKYWRVPANEIPSERAARVRWLDSCWQQIDDWIDQSLG